MSLFISSHKIFHRSKSEKDINYLTKNKLKATEKEGKNMFVRSFGNPYPNYYDNENDWYNYVSPRQYEQLKWRQQEMQ